MPTQTSLAAPPTPLWIRMSNCVSGPRSQLNTTLAVRFYIRMRRNVNRHVNALAQIRHARVGRGVERIFGLVTLHRGAA